MPGYSLPQSHCLGVLCLTAVIYTQPARAHDPVFGLGPHVLYKGGVEIAPALHWKSRAWIRRPEPSWSRPGADLWSEW